MGYHHLALATKDMQAIHEFYEGIMDFELVKVEMGPAPSGGFSKHFFYRMEDDSKFIAFWELHDVPGTENMETNIAAGAGVPQWVNHIAFDVHSHEELDRRRQQWLNAGVDVMEIDHNWCHSIYATDPNGNMVEFCLTTGQFTDQDRERALTALTQNDLEASAPPKSQQFHKAAS